MTRRALAKRLAAVYVRVSSRARDDDAADNERQANSFDEQKQSAEVYLQHEGLTAAEGYVAHERESAAKAGTLRVKNGRIEIDAARKKWIKLVELLLAENCPVRTLVVQTSDRLSRNHIDDQLIEELIEHGVEIHFLREGIVVNRDNWAEHRFSIRARQMISGEEGAIKAARVQAGRRSKARKKLYVGSRAPTGYRWQAITGSRRGQNRELEEDPVTGPNVRELFRLAATGLYGSNELWQMGIKMGLFRGGGAHSPLRRWFSNPIFIGGYRWTPPGMKKSVDVMDGENPALIDPATFFKVQEILAVKRRTTRPRRRKRVYMLSGLLACAHCGRRLTPNRKKGVYWTCVSRGGGCGHSMKEEVIIKLLAEQLDRLSLAPEQAGIYAEQLSDYLTRRAPVPTAQIEGELAKTRKTIARHRDRLADEDLDAGTLALIKRKLAAALAEEEKLAAEKAATARSVVNLRTDIDTARRLLTEGALMGQRWLRLRSDEKRRALLERVLAAPTKSRPDLAVQVDLDEGALSLLLRPAWETIRRLARGQAHAARTAKRPSGPPPRPPEAPRVKPLAIQM